MEQEEWPLSVLEQRAFYAEVAKTLRHCYGIQSAPWPGDLPGSHDHLKVWGPSGGANESQIEFYLPASFDYEVGSYVACVDWTKSEDGDHIDARQWNEKPTVDEVAAQIENYYVKAERFSWQRIG